MRISRQVGLLQINNCIALRLTIGQGKKDFETEISKSLLLAKKIYYYKEKEHQAFAKAELAEYLQDPIEKYTSSGKECEELKKELEEFLNLEDEEEKKIPEFLQCPITCDLMENPTLLSSGHTYEKDQIKKHFLTNGYKDPMTGEQVSPTLIENINLRQAIEDFIEK